jgi:hypothetical protein
VLRVSSFLVKSFHKNNEKSAVHQSAKMYFKYQRIGSKNGYYGILVNTLPEAQPEDEERDLFPGWTFMGSDEGAEYYRVGGPFLYWLGKRLMCPMYDLEILDDFAEIDLYFDDGCSCRRERKYPSYVSVEVVSDELMSQTVIIGTPCDEVPNFLEDSLKATCQSCGCFDDLVKIPNMIEDNRLCRKCLRAMAES